MKPPWKLTNVIPVRRLYDWIWFCPKNSSRNSNAANHVPYYNCHVFEPPHVLKNLLFEEKGGHCQLQSLERLLEWRRHHFEFSGWSKNGGVKNPTIHGRVVDIFIGSFLKTRTQQVPHVWTNPLISLQTSRPRQRFAHGRSQRCCHPPAVVHSSSSGRGATQIPRNGVWVSYSQSPP